MLIIKLKQETFQQFLEIISFQDLIFQYLRNTQTGIKADICQTSINSQEMHVNTCKDNIIFKT